MLRHCKCYWAAVCVRMTLKLPTYKRKCSGKSFEALASVSFGCCSFQCSSVWMLKFMTLWPLSKIQHREIFSPFSVFSSLLQRCCCRTYFLLSFNLPVHDPRHCRCCVLFRPKVCSILLIILKLRTFGLSSKMPKICLPREIAWGDEVVSGCVCVLANVILSFHKMNTDRVWQKTLRNLTWTARLKALRQTHQLYIN